MLPDQLLHSIGNEFEYTYQPGMPAHDIDCWNAWVTATPYIGPDSNVIQGIEHARCRHSTWISPEYIIERLIVNGDS